MIFQQSRLKAGASLAVLAGAIVAAAGAVSAQNNDGESFELTVSMMTTGAQRSVAIGESTMAQAVNQTVQVFNADASGFLGYATGNCVTFQTVDMAESTIELNGYCNYRDAEGDIAFEQFGTTGSVSLSELSFDGTFIGGTGKYESLTGTTRTTLNAETQNGDAVLVGGTKTGTFMLAEMAEEPAAEEPAAEEPAAEEPVAEEPAAEEPAAEEPAAEEPAAEEPAAEEPAAEEPAAEEPVAEVNEEEQLAAAMSLGEDVFGDRCAGCHGNDGQGGNGPALAGNSIVASARNVVNMVIVGYADHGMPAFGDVLNNEEIAAAATYVRNSWGNDFGIVLPSTVERYR